MSTTDHRCGNCGERSYKEHGNRFCWWCNEDLWKDDPCCPECGQAKDLTNVVADYVRRAQLE